MPLTVENSPELLNEEVNMATQKTQRVKVTRAFYHKNQVIGKDSIVDFSMSMATELRHANKVEFVQSDTKIKRNTDIPSPPDAALKKTIDKEKVAA